MATAVVIPTATRTRRTKARVSVKVGARGWRGSTPRVATVTTVVAVAAHHGSSSPSASDDDGASSAAAAASSSSSSSRRRVLTGLVTAAGSLAMPRSLLPAARADDLFCGYYKENLSVTPQWAFKTPWSEGFVDVSAATKLKDAKTFLRILGDEKIAKEAGHLPVLCVHGGPGLGFKYMEACEVLASEKREVASYDQIGCARSPFVKGKDNVVPSPGTYTPELFARELTRVREAGGLERCHVVAHGWGGMLALDHILGGNGVAKSGGAYGGNGVASLTLVGVPPSYARLIADRRAALDGMPEDMREVLLEGDENGAAGSNLSETGKALYEKAMAEWIQRHESSRAAGTCYAGLRLGGAGDGYGALRANAATDAGRKSAAAVARDMTGGMMFSVGGALASWEADDGGRLAQLTAAVPAVRLLRGERDALSSEAVREVYEGIARAEMKPRVTFEEVEGAGSSVHLDRSADFLEGVNAFISSWDCNGERFCNDAAA